MKIRKNMIIPIGAILILGLYLLFNNTGQINYTVPEFTIIDTLEMETININGPNGTIDLYSDNGVWKLNPDNLRAEPSRIKDMLSFLENPIFIDMVSNTKNYQNYGLNNNEYITVKVKIKSNKSKNPDRELYIGDLNETDQFVFVRIPDNKAVFTLKANIKNMFDVNEKDLIDKKILNYDTSKIIKINIISDDKIIMLNKSVDSENKDIWKSESGLDLNSETVDQGLRYLVNSRFDSYSPGEEINDGKNLLKLNLYEAEIIHSFTIIKKKDEGYSANSAFTDREFLLSENTGSQIMKMFSDIFEAKGE
jgi:Domain of unknown function (DUF4340)